MPFDDNKIRAFLPGFNAGTFHLPNAAGSSQNALDPNGLQRGGTVVPSKLADRTDDARSDETFGLTETKEGSECLVINVNRRSGGLASSPVESHLR